MTEKRGTEGVAEEAAQTVGGVALLSNLFPTSGSTPFTAFQCSTAQNTGRALNCAVSTFILDLASPLARSMTEGFAFCFMGHGFSCEMQMVADETTCFFRVFIGLSLLRGQGGDT